MRARPQRRSETAATCLALSSTLQLPPWTREATIVPFVKHAELVRTRAPARSPRTLESEGYWMRFCGGVLLEVLDSRCLHNAYAVRRARRADRNLSSYIR